MNVIQHAWVSFVLSVAETLILYWLCSNFLHRNLRPMSQYTVGILIYFIFQWVTYWFNAPLFSMCVFYCAFTMLVSCIFFTDSLRTKVLVAYLFVVLNYACKLLSAVLLRFLHNEPLWMRRCWKNLETWAEPLLQQFSWYSLLWRHSLSHRSSQPWL